MREIACHKPHASTSTSMLTYLHVMTAHRTLRTHDVLTRHTWCERVKIANLGARTASVSFTCVQSTTDSLWENSIVSQVHCRRIKKYSWSWRSIIYASANTQIFAQLLCSEVRHLMERAGKQISRGGDIWNKSFYVATTARLTISLAI